MSLHRIDEIFNFEKGSLQSSKCEAGEYNFITASADWKTHQEFTYDCEALVFAAAAAGSLGRTHYVNDKFIASDLCFVLTPKDAENFPVDLKFYHLIFRELRQDIVKNTKAGTSKEAISLGSFARYELPYFNIETQNEIKGRFVEAEATKTNLSARLDRQLALVKELRQAYLREAMQGKLVPQDPTDEPAEILLEKIKAEKEKLVAEKRIKQAKPLPPINPEETPFEIPSKWTWCKLGEVAQVKIGSTPSRQNLSLWNGNINWVSSGEVANNYIYSTRERIAASAIENTSLSVYPKGSVLVAMIGQGKTRGQTAILKIDATTNQNVAGLIINNDFLSSEFLWFFFRSRYELTRSGASGGNQPALNGIKISNTLFPLPPLAEQERIVAKLEKLMRFCDELEANIKQGITNADRLLQTALREALEPGS